MLTLVPPPTGGQGGGAPKHRRRSIALSLNAEERRGLAATLRSLRAAFGSWKAVSRSMGGIAVDTLCSVASGKNPGSPALVLRAARAARTTVENILAPAPRSADRCPHCGAKRGAG